MTSDQRSKVAGLKAAIAATVGAGTPLNVRAAVVELKQEFRRDGITARVLAKAVGIHESTLCGWAQQTMTPRAPRRATTEHPRSAGFRVVQLEEEIATSRSAPSSSSSLSARPSTAPTRGLRVVHAPSGLVVDGLDVETLALLLRRMA